MSVDVLEIVWNNIKIEAKLLINSESVLNNFIHTMLLKHKNFKSALVCMLSKKLVNIDITMSDITRILENVYNSDQKIVIFAAQDIYAIRYNDPAVNKYSTPFLYSKGFHALQIHRIAHWLWCNDRQDLAMYFYHHISTVFNVDIHPAASIGCGVMIDHATGVVIGETAVVENDVSIMQSVTLGGTGKIIGDRHPKVRQGVMIGAGSIILGNIEIGYGSKIGAGSVVLHSVPPYVTVAGKPAVLVEKNQ